MQCASSTYYNYAVNTVPRCAGSTTVVSTVSSIASAYASSTFAALASWSAAAAVPSAECSILSDSGFGDSTFMVYGINGWAGEDGSKLHEEEDGCGLLSNWQRYVGDVEEFQGRPRIAQHAAFQLSFFEGGCVERAIMSAGGPEITCHNSQGGRKRAASQTRVQRAQVDMIQSLAQCNSARAWNGDVARPQPTRTAQDGATRTQSDW